MRAAAATSAKNTRREEGEAKRDDEHYFYVACWDYAGNDNTAPTLIKEPSTMGLSRYRPATTNHKQYLHLH